jgi:hypothetical protein
VVRADPSVDCSAQEVAGDLVGAWCLAADAVDEATNRPEAGTCDAEALLDSMPLLARLTLDPPTIPRMVDSDLAFFRLSVLNGPSFRVLVVREDSGR